MRHIHLLVLAALVATVALVVQVGGAAAAGSVRVTSSSDGGPGSFRAAVTHANVDSSVTQIVFVGALAPIALASPVVYTGDQSLELVGNGAVLDGAGLAGTTDVFRAETHGNLSLIGLTIQNAPGEGLEYQVPSNASGTKQVVLNGVRVLGGDPELGRGGHGVLINDQTFPDSGDPDNGIPPDPAGSAAALEVSVLNSEFARNGFGALDRDGLRVNEGGAGNLEIVVRNTVAAENGINMRVLSERGECDAVFTVSWSTITGNGSFHELFPPLDPDDIDLDDGMDVDESNAGAVRGWVYSSMASDNFEEGWDLNENDAGDFVVDMTNVEASRNLEEGVDFEEDDDFAGGGDLVTTLVGVTANDNEGGDAGLKIREKGDGNLAANVRDALANANDGDGVNLREDAAGSLVGSVDHSTARENDGDGLEFEENGAGDLSATADQSTNDGNGQDGVEFDENGAGDLAGTVSRGSASNNDAAGVRADQQVPGAGTLRLDGMTLNGNATGPVVAVNVVVTQTP